MVKEAHATFEEVFTQSSSADSIKLLSWCVSSAFPFYYMSDMLVTATQQEEDVPATITVP